MERQTRVVKGVEELARAYSGFILDQYGVLHNGKYALPGAVTCVEKLAEAGKRIVILSNSTRRAADTCERLVNMGFPREAISGAVTSGEESYNYLKEHYKGRKCCFMEWAKEKTNVPFAAGLDLTYVEPEQADFFLCYGTSRIVTGPDPVKDVREVSYYDDGDIEPLKGFLQRVIKAEIPTICCNPDVTVISQKGSSPEIKYPPGGISKYLKSHNAKVLDFGKPNKEHFSACLRMLGEEKSPQNVCHCGDSLEHDIQGANNAAVHSLFVGGGIHAKELNMELQAASEIEPKALAALFEKHGQIVPTYSMPMFRW